MPRPTAAQRPDPAAVLTKGLLRASELLDLTSATLARVLGVSEASISRIVSGARRVDPDSKEGELALLLGFTLREQLAHALENVGVRGVRAQA